MVVTWKKIDDDNVINAAVLWSIWESRNDMCFQGVHWRKMEKLYGRCAGVIRNWKLVNMEVDAGNLATWADQMEERGLRPPRIEWHGDRADVPGADVGFSVRDANQVMSVNGQIGPVFSGRHRTRMHKLALFSRLRPHIHGRIHGMLPAAPRQQRRSSS
jgi:hypothetical protein